MSIVNAPGEAHCDKNSIANFCIYFMNAARKLNPYAAYSQSATEFLNILKEQFHNKYIFLQEFYLKHHLTRTWESPSVQLRGMLQVLDCIDAVKINVDVKYICKADHETPVETRVDIELYPDGYITLGRRKGLIIRSQPGEKCKCGSETNKITIIKASLYVIMNCQIYSELDDFVNIGGDDYHLMGIIKYTGTHYISMMKYPSVGWRVCDYEDDPNAKVINAIYQHHSIWLTWNK